MNKQKQQLHSCKDIFNGASSN